jgi:uncharacterized membrane protein YhfC
MNILLITYFLNGFLMIAMPVGLAIFLTRKFGLAWRLWWIGVATFVLSQVGHIPFNYGMSWLLNQTALVSWPWASQLVFNAVFLGLSAGLWEEGMRYLVLRSWARDARSWQQGVLFGAGHGGIEAILLGVIVLAGYVSMIVMQNTDLSALPADQLKATQQAVLTYWSADWPATLLGALERFFTIPVQIVMALLVLQAFTRKQIRWLFAAIGYHAVIDATAVLGQQYVTMYWLEAILGVFAAISILLIFVLRRGENSSANGPDDPSLESAHSL